MKLLRRGDSDNSDSSQPEKNTPDPVEKGAGATTVGKGRPTPKRKDAEGKRRGPVAPAPMTSKEARARRKANRGTKADRKAAAAERRQLANIRRAGMAAGDEKYLMPRDKGPVRAYVRDIIDSRRNLVGGFMPLALILIAVTFLLPPFASIGTLAMLIMMLFMAIEGVYLGKMVNRRVRERFPDSADGGWKLGWYAFSRASQIKKMRLPKPRVKPGDAV